MAKSLLPKLSQSQTDAVGKRIYFDCLLDPETPKPIHVLMAFHDVGGMTNNNIIAALAHMSVGATVHNIPIDRAALAKAIEVLAAGELRRIFDYSVDHYTDNFMDIDEAAVRDLLENVGLLADPGERQAGPSRVTPDRPHEEQSS